MAGLNYGMTYHLQKDKRKLGVSYSEHIKKYIVRILKKGIAVSIAKFDTEEEANIFYNNLINKMKN